MSYRLFWRYRRWLALDEPDGVHEVIPKAVGTDDSGRGDFDDSKGFFWKIKGLRVDGLDVWAISVLVGSSWTRGSFLA